MIEWRRHDFLPESREAYLVGPVRAAKFELEYDDSMFVYAFPNGSLVYETTPLWMWAAP